MPIGPAKVGEDLDIPATSFPKFRQIPLETRRMIWMRSLPSGRIYEPKPYNDWIMYDPRPQREAWTGAQHASIWYNDEQDAVYLHTFDQWNSLDRFDVKNICTRKEIALNREHCERVLGNLDCNRVIVACYPVGTLTEGQLTETFPVCRSIRSEDEFVTIEEVDPEDWDEGLELTWREDKAFNKDCWEREKLGKSVKFEAVEVFRKARKSSSL
ncbi:uncharacterized protein LY79DRAFT_574998 [Colletotrichum navitas]|uniref:2EXR domain-containing protein n=1 Tax=Colletotrichum navitas TaxID=681940 RepID=A0AAD8QE30_9PEZI|nr:uncharacterized protein LY79DRAFT_574998 [Colletotrichum navitas]KAK1600760.1 hypothetical protein LY79DRAFT_574998 [Colletotrichum navitas]